MGFNRRPPRQFDASAIEGRRPRQGPPRQFNASLVQGRRANAFKATQARPDPFGRKDIAKSFAERRDLINQGGVKARQAVDTGTKAAQEQVAQSFARQRAINRGAGSASLLKAQGQVTGDIERDKAQQIAALESNIAQAQAGLEGQELQATTDFEKFTADKAFKERAIAVQELVARGELELSRIGQLVNSITAFNEAGVRSAADFQSLFQNNGLSNLFADVIPETQEIPRFNFAGTKSG